jgi:hypothetical protein
MFWHGTLTEHQIQSMLSFKKHGFDVWFWSFDKYDIPDGITKKDASTVLSRDIMDNNFYIHWSENSPGGNYYPIDKSSAVFYSDYLRIKLLSMFGGWWFDCDVVCLKPVIWFKNISKTRSICAAWQFEDSVNNAVLSIPNRQYAKELINYIDNNISKHSSFFWGHFGPDMITKFVKKHSLEHEILNVRVFYPFSPENYDYLKPWSESSDDILECTHRVKDSATLHWFDNLMFEKKVSSDSFMGVLMNE